ncbi:MAG: hypothetical protein RIE74_08010 [Pseudomonadales bacterium]
MTSIVRWLPVFAACLAGCATLDQHAVGRTDRLAAPPFIVTYQRAPVGGHTLVLPATLDPITTEHYQSDGRAAALQPLLNAIDAALAGHACCDFQPTPVPAQGAPSLYVGSVDGEHAPAGTGIEQEDHEEYPPLIAHMLKPTPAWQTQIAELAAAHGAARVVRIQVSFTQFPKADKGFFGKKVVLGTHHEQDIRLLSAVDKPVEVLALTGVVVDSRGEVLRGGVEGIAGYDAPFLVQVLEMGRDIDPTAIDRLVNEERRADLPGTPLKWQAALDQLLHQLLRDG